jgi:(p)ppGpp synthase/HD superfamily hydrolase
MALLMTNEMPPIVYEIDLVKKAREYAIKAHGDQMYGENPYVYHLDNVYNKVKEFSNDPVNHCVAFLHDVLEDTDISFEELESEFGLTITKAVNGLSDAKGINRKERKLRTYSKIRTNNVSLQVKLCDRICNMEESMGNSYSKMYIKEYDSFKSALYTYPLYSKEWRELDRLYKKMVGNNGKS